MQPIVALSFLGLATLGAVACGGDERRTTEPPSPVAVASVILSPTTATLVVGTVSEFTATARDSAGKTLTGRDVVWTTTDPMVAWVSDVGEAKGEGEGSVTITATIEGVSASAVVSVAAAVPTGTPVTFASIVTGGAHSCALTSSGAAYCWGRGESGQLGAPPPTTQCILDVGPLACSAYPVSVGGGLSFSLLTAGGAHTCGLTSDGSAWCWGRNNSGQLGDGSNTSRFAPVAVATGLKFASIDAGGEHTCALTSGGAAYCWGRNTRGQLGDGMSTARSSPTPVSGGLTFRSITAGGFAGVGGPGNDHTCALASNGAAYCWGDNEAGQLGQFTSDLNAHAVPAPVAGDGRYSAITAGLGRHTCALSLAGTASCWGQNSFGALGNGNTSNSSAPVAVSGGYTFARLVAGGFIGHTCGVTSSGVTTCWGDNERGQAGDASTNNRLQPVRVKGELPFVELDAGFSHTCGRTATGSVYCWGAGAAGQLGTGLAKDRAVPGRVVGKP